MLYTYKGDCLLFKQKLYPKEILENNNAYECSVYPIMRYFFPKNLTISEVEEWYEVMFHACLAEEYHYAFHRIYTRIMPFIEQYELREFDVRCLNLFIHLDDLSYLEYDDGYIISHKYTLRGNVGDYYGWARATAGVALAIVGRVKEAIDLLESAIDELPYEAGTHNVPIARTNLINFALLPAGQVNKAKSIAKECIDLAKELDSPDEAIRVQDFAHVMHHIGDLVETLYLYKRVVQCLRKHNAMGYFYGVLGTQYCEFLIDFGYYKKARFFINEIMRMLTVQAETEIVKNINIGRALYIKGKIAVAINSHDAKLVLDKALYHVKKSGWVNETIKVYILRIKFMRYQKQFTEALYELGFVQELIYESNMNLYIADAALLSGNLTLDCKEKPPEDIGDEFIFGCNRPPREDYIGRALAHYKRAAQSIETTSYHLRDPELMLLEARIAYYQNQNPELILKKARNCLEEMGYWSLLPEWENIVAECDYKKTKLLPKF